MKYWGFHLLVSIIYVGILFDFCEYNFLFYLYFPTWVYEEVFTSFNDMILEEKYFYKVDFNDHP